MAIMKSFSIMRAVTTRHQLWLQPCLRLLFCLALVFSVSAPLDAHAQQVRVECPGNHPAGSLQAYMCSVKASDPGAKLYFSIDGAIDGQGRVLREYFTDPVADNTMASMAKTMTAFMAIEMLMAQEGTTGLTHNNYRRSGVTLDTKVRIVRNPAEYRNSAQAIYVGPGFASSPCARPNDGAPWGAGITAKFAFYDPTKQGTPFDYSLTIRNLIDYAMVPSANDAAMLLGAIVADHLGINSLGTAGTVNSGAHANWVGAFSRKMDESADRLIGPTDIGFCAPSGWSATGSSAGCSKRNVATQVQFGRLAKEIYRRAWDYRINTGRMSNPNLGATPRYGALLSQALTGSSFNTILPNTNGRCETRPVLAVANSAGGLRAGLAGANGSNVRVIKTGSITAPENLVVVAEAINGELGNNCQNFVMTGVLMRPDRQAALNRQFVLGNMMSQGVATATNGRCAMPFNADAVPQVGRMGLNSGASAEHMAFLEANYGSFETPADMWLVGEPVDATGTGRDGPPAGFEEPGVTGASTASDAECAPEVRLAEQWGQQVKEAHQFGIAERLFDGLVDQFFSQQCVGRLINLMQDVMSAVDTVRTIASSADMMSAVVAAAAGAIVRAILDQVFAWITNAICTVTDKIIGAIDNVSKNLLCFKNPLFSIPNKPFEIPIDIEAISCSGLAINPLYFSGDPNQPLGRGNIAGLDLGSVRSGDRPFFCPTGTRLAQRSVPGTAGQPIQQYYCQRAQQIECRPPMRPNGRGGCENIPVEQGQLPPVQPRQPAGDGQCGPNEIMGVNGCAPRPGG